MLLMLSEGFYPLTSKVPFSYCYRIPAVTKDKQFPETGRIYRLFPSCKHSLSTTCTQPINTLSTLVFLSALCSLILYAVLLLRAVPFKSVVGGETEDN